MADPLDWSDIKFGPESKEHTQLDEQHLKDAVGHLRKFLGEDFPRIAAESRHPLYWYFVNMAPWTRQWLIQFDEALRAATRFTNASALAERMKDATKFPEALSVLECAGLFSNYDFQIGIEPKDLEAGFGRVPDLLAKVPSLNSTLCIEVTTLGESRESRDVMAKFDRISRQLFFSSHRLASIGRMKRAPSEPRMRELEQKIVQTMELATELGTMQTFETPELEIAVAPDSHRDAIRSWGAAHGIESGSFVGPSSEDNTIQRLTTRLREKMTQLPSSLPGVVWIELQALGAHDSGALDYDALEDILHEYPHVIAVIITWKMGFIDDELPEQYQPKSRTRAIARKRAGYQYAFYRLLENEHSTVPIAAGTMSRLRRAVGF